MLPLLLQCNSHGLKGCCRGLEHTQAGYMIGAATTFKYAFDYHDDDIYWCTADCGWITGCHNSPLQDLARSHISFKVLRNRTHKGSNG